MTYSEYLDRVVQLIRLNHKSGQSLTAAVLGSFISSAIPEATFKDFGKRHLREVLADLQDANWIVITATEKGALAVQPRTEVGHPVAVEAAPASARPVPLKKRVWEAFVFPVPAGKRFGHRQSADIRTGLVESPNPVGDWVEISQISNDIQYTWALDFVAAEVSEHVAIIDEALRAPLWNPVVFAQVLRGLDPSLAKRWNAYRSKMTAEHVRGWLTQVGLPHSWAFESLARPATAKKPADSPAAAVSPGQSVPTFADPDADSRQIILAALAQLPLSKLLELPIPAGVLLNAVASRSSR
ncbi:hypothetical protein D7Y42_03830 [Stenotrophomonas maltophilia]|uniref:hypothetical protein n=1 Tax=Stenotrophomonas TaxID=40323 RepID=UPI0015DD5592|nr:MULTISPECIES: hypothetical protein [Stenotrophomonas]EKT4081813.1 hypothetical protein [Stenotrophomonas maltophilia]MBA0369843.1 hypothetical protein [Stenotrophomonas maltophilia]